MEEISQERLEKVLELYKSECRYLKNAKLDLLKAIGTFEMGDTFYTAAPLNHLAEAEAKICLCQLAYVAFAEWIDNGEFDGINLEFDEYLQLMKENMYVVESNIKFKKPIGTEQQFKLEMRVIQEKPFENTRIVRMGYSFEDGKAKGEIWFALVLNKESQ